ncbi:MAG: restriction endonuclease [Methanolinea sp.]|nr:restriction endonuclease [Methanolinea sp.]
MDEGTPGYWKEQGNEAIARRDARKAISHYTRALLLDPDYGPAWHNLGLVCGKLGHAEAARYCLSVEDALSRGEEAPDPGEELMAHVTAGSNAEVIDLDALDGYAFEEICGEIYRRLGYRVEQTPPVRDGGRDLVLHAPGGEEIVVECKHQPEGTVGRPVVQKLHSAVISSGASRGILVATGRFSQDAVAHAATLSPPITLVDRAILADLAARAGFALRAAGEREAIWVYPVSPLPATWRWIASDLAAETSGFPLSFPALRPAGRRISLSPAYVVTYDIHFECATSVGVIHREEARGRRVSLDGATGGEVPDHGFLAETPVLAFSQPRDLPPGVSRGTFAVDSRTAREIALDRILRAHARRVVYYGRNNQRYVKECVPARRDVLVRDVRQVLVPRQEIAVAGPGRTYAVRLLESGKALRCSPDLWTCGSCAGFTRGEKKVLCNSCGALVHAPSLLDPCSAECRSCGKTICRSCTLVSGWGKKLCAECARRTDPSARPAGKGRYQGKVLAAACGTGGLALLYFANPAGFLLLLVAIALVLSGGKKPVPEHVVVEKRGG